VPLGASHFAVADGGKTAPVENEDYASSLVHFENGARGYSRRAGSASGRTSG
jgi:hypothetical protein